jgi:hypothetical protein
MALLGEMTTISGKLTISKNTLKIDENRFMHSITVAASSIHQRQHSIWATF